MRFIDTSGKPDGYRNGEPMQWYRRDDAEGNKVITELPNINEGKCRIKLLLERIFSIIQKFTKYRHLYRKYQERCGGTVPYV